ncbi:MAG: O-antigen ligase family protein [Polyangiaceae bacterium]
MAGTVLFAGVVLASALLLGSLHTRALIGVSVAMAVASAVLTVSRSTFRMTRSATIVLSVLLGLLAFTWFQLVPLPAAWVARVSPHTADVWARALRPLTESGPLTIPLSLDPVATRVQVLRGTLYVATFVGSLVLARKPGQRTTEAILIGAPLVVALVSLAHPAVEARSVYGIYSPENADFGVRTGPLLNKNHLSAYLNVGLAVALASAVDARPRGPRILYVAFVAVLLTTIVWIASRGGMIGLAVSITVTLALTWVARRGHARATPNIVLSAIIALVAAGALFVSGDREILHELLDRDVSKLALVRNAMDVGRAFPLVGAGRGAFESVFPEFRTLAGGYVTFTHPENVIAQWTAEWGFVVSAVALTSLLFALRPSVPLSRSRPPVGAYAALAGLFVHNFVDFSLEVPAVVVLAMVAAGAVVGGSRLATEEKAVRRLPQRVRFVGFLAVSTIAAVIVASRAIGVELEDDRATFRTFVAAPPTGGVEAFRDLYRAAALRHPAEPYFSYAGSLLALNSGTEDPIRWSSHALERAIQYGPAHYVLARALVQRSPSQARLEFRLALANGSGSVTEAIPLIRSFDDATELLPPGNTRGEVIEVIARSVAERLPATTARLDEILLEKPATAGPPTVRRVRRALAWMNDASLSAVDVEGARTEAAAASRELLERSDASCTGLDLLAPLNASVRGELDVAAELSRRVESQASLGCIQALAAVVDATRQADRYESRFANARRVACVRHAPGVCVDTCLYLAARDVARGRSASALAHYRAAIDSSPARDDIRLLLAQTSSSLGLHGAALETYRVLVAKDPSNASLVSAIRREEEALLRQPTMPSASPFPTSDDTDGTDTARP